MDLISREDAIRWVKTECNPYGKPTLDFESGKKVIEHLEQMPSAQPDRKHGYWVESQEHVYMGNSVKEWTNWYCSECDAPNDNPSDFCPSCGADMRGEQDG